MKKTSLLFVVLMLSFTIAQSQSKSAGDVFEKGSSAINLGIGFGNTVYHGGYYSMGFPTISVSYEYGIVDIPMGSSLKGVVSAGGLVGFGSSKYDYSHGTWGYEYKSNYILIAVRGNYHFIFHDKFDPYAGIILGYYIAFGSNKVTYPPGYPSYLPKYSGSNGGFHGGAYAGARWFFTPAFAVFSELGWSISIFTIGATFKF
jgi:hypothetical protein